MKGTFQSVRVVGLLLGAVAALASSNPVRAQEDVRYTFVLPFDVQWQGKTLPAGEYHFTAQAVPSDESGSLFIRDAQGRAKVAAMPVTLETSGQFSPQSELTIVSRNGKRYVRSLHLGPIGTTRVYSVPSQKRAVESNLEASRQVIPVQIVKTGS